jgi:hypothetical protein
VRCALALTFVAALLVPAAATPATRTGLVGTVRRGPITPVCFENRPCDEPAANVTIVFTRNGREARVRTKQDGSYRIALAPGTYRVRTTPKAAVGGTVEPAKVRVRPGGRTRANLFIDTGIR